MQELHDCILEHTGSSEITSEVSVQTLWSGYGEIKRYWLSGGEYPSIVVKYIKWPEERDHPRGWNTDISHQRKLRSYEVEIAWYRHYSLLTNEQCKIPELIHAVEEEDHSLLIMEDLNASGYDLRLDPDSIKLADVKNVLSWLAQFHAVFMGKESRELWPIGTYWHLDTRPDEWNNMRNMSLKNAAKAIDNRLNKAKYQTLVHGDAKLANFCFGSTGALAAVDFQYVGRGCGMKDVAYFVSSCFHEEDCEKYEEELLNHYFEQLRSALNPGIDFTNLKSEWNDLYAFSWADFYRFLDGWSPGHWKMHDYSERMTSRVIDQITSENA